MSLTKVEYGTKGIMHLCPSCYRYYKQNDPKNIHTKQGVRYGGICDSCKKYFYGINEKSKTQGDAKPFNAYCEKCRELVPMEVKKFGGGYWGTCPKCGISRKVEPSQDWLTRAGMDTLPVGQLDPNLIKKSSKIKQLMEQYNRMEKLLTDKEYLRTHSKGDLEVALMQLQDRINAEIELHQLSGMGATFFSFDNLPIVIDERNAKCPQCGKPLIVKEANNVNGQNLIQCKNCGKNSILSLAGETPW